MSVDLARALEKLSRVPGVRGALIVDAEAGVPVVAEVSDDLDGTALAALAASVYRRCVRATRAAEFGRVTAFQLEAGRGHLVIAGTGALLVAALTEEDAQLGMVHLEARRAAKELQ